MFCSIWFKVLLLLVVFWVFLSQVEMGWQLIQEIICKSDKDNCQYQVICLDNGMVVLLVFDLQVVKLFLVLVVFVGLLEDFEVYQGLVYYFEYMSLMGLKKYLQVDSLVEYFKMYGGSYNVSIVLYCMVFYLEVENDVLSGVVDCLVDVIVEFLFDKKYVECECNVVNVELIMVCMCDGMCMVQVSVEIINLVYFGLKFFGGNFEILSDKSGNLVQQVLKDFYEKYYFVKLMKVVIYSNKLLLELVKMVVDIFGCVLNKESKKLEIIVLVVIDV